MIINHAKLIATNPALSFWAEDNEILNTMPMNGYLAHTIAWTMGYPSKMPGTSYGIPAAECQLGSKLAKIKGTTCEDCYALKGNYVYHDVKRAQYIRLAGTKHPRWVDAMVYLLTALHSNEKRPKGVKGKKIKAKGFHRWHDAGDLQSVAHFAKICEVARRTPHIKHWLPTREINMILAAYNGIVPENLLVRISATKVDGNATTQWPHTSGVHHLAPAKGLTCGAPLTGNACADCRACWSHDVAHVSYHKH